MARPPLSEEDKPIIIMVKLRLYPGRHDRLIAFFKRIPDRLRAASVIQVMNGGSLDTLNIDELPSDDDIMASFDGLLG
mgnify:CR=1 FL=1